jgi:hypothetical protein
MDIYNLGKIVSRMDTPRGAFLFGFDVIGVQGRPVVGFSFATEAEAIKAAQRAGIAHAKQTDERAYLGRKPSFTRAPGLMRSANGWDRIRCSLKSPRTLG